MNVKNLSLLLFLLISLSACHQEVKPWEKGTLAQANMQLGGGDAMIKKINEHIFTSKEASFGGNGIGGGGCGCN
ncbi:DUF4266 domain-containing protein [Malaciobacter sp. WC5094]|uniref:DUF4266 domain-containing protein n=1 Tax=Arcobacter sp. YIC-80 TaxID=3376683 RepID=UPI00384E7D25